MCDGVDFTISDAVNKLKPVQIVAEVFGGYTTKSCHSSFKAVVVGVGILDMIKALHCLAVLA